MLRFFKYKNRTLDRWSVKVYFIAFFIAWPLISTRLITLTKYTNLFHRIKICCLYPSDLLPQTFLNGLHLVPGLLIVHKVDRHTPATKASRSPYTVDVCLQVRRHVSMGPIRSTLAHKGEIVVNYHVHLHDVYAPGNDIRRD